MAKNAPLHLVASTAVCTALLAFLVGCGGDDEEARRPAIAASTSVSADIVRRLAGDDLEVTQVVPDGSSPHSYAPSASEQAEMLEADLLVYFHPALEGSLPFDLAENTFVVSDHSNTTRPFQEGEVAGEHDDEHGAGSEDPHVWLNPLAIKAALPDLAKALAEIDAAHAPDFERRAGEYAAELDALDAELSEIASTVPPEDRKLVTSHDLMGYFADRYGYTVIGAPFGIAPEAEASAGELEHLIEEVEKSGVPAIFAQVGDDPEVLRTVTEETGVEVVDDLLLESLGPDGETYLEMMRYSAERIASALGG